MLEAQEIPAKLSELIRPADVHLELLGVSQHEVLRELVSPLGLDAANSETLVKVLQRRESMGSTGVGHGVAVPHCRTALVDRIRIVFGRQLQGVPWCGADGEPVLFFFCWSLLRSKFRTPIYRCSAGSPVSSTVGRAASASPRSTHRRSSST
jgi:mannitol/fructose-specific phosphotransferase system IIA component